MLDQMAAVDPVRIRSKKGSAILVDRILVDRPAGIRPTRADPAPPCFRGVTLHGRAPCTDPA
jgi:hypothetical protein